MTGLFMSIMTFVWYTKMMIGKKYSDYSVPIHFNSTSLYVKKSITNNVNNKKNNHRTRTTVGTKLQFEIKCIKLS